MKNLAFSFLLAFGLCSCGSSTSEAFAQEHTLNYGGATFTCDQSQLDHPDKVSARSLTTPAFEKLDASVGVEVLYTQGSGRQAQVKVTATKEYAEYLVVREKNGTFTVAWDQDRMRRDLGNKKFKVAARVEVTAPAFHRLEAEAGSKVLFTNGLTVRGEFEADLSSGASLTAGRIKATEVDVETSSGASIKSSTVECKQYKASTSAGSTIRIKGITATDEVELDASSGSVMEVEFTESRGHFKADVSSGASIEVSGTASGDVRLDASSGGVIRASSLSVHSYRSDVSSGGSVRKPKIF